MRVLESIALLALLAVALPAQQAPLVEGPYVRAELRSGCGHAHIPISTQAKRGQELFDQGLALLHAGDDREAERCFRELVACDPDCAMGWWGLALANDRHPSRALEFAWDAWSLREGARAAERTLIGVWARALGATEEPEWDVVDAETGRRRARPRVATDGARPVIVEALSSLAGRAAADDPEPVALAVREAVRGRVLGDPEPGAAGLLEVLSHRAPRHPAQRYRAFVADVGGADAGSPWAAGLAAPGVARAWEACGWLHAPASRESIRAHATAMRLDHARMQATGAIPCEIDGYARNVERLARSLADAGHVAEARRLARRLTALPRHPRFADGAPQRGARLLVDLAAFTAPANAATLPGPRPAGLPDLEATGPADWSPCRAPGFDLPDGRGGRLSLPAGRPSLVVFFLGFGCIHCVEQLHALRPHARDFESAGIELIAIGTDTVDEVKASIQRQIENDAPPMPFPVLCDPERERFDAWGCRDEFAGEALHGTFLVDAKGRILWRDVSIEPFMATGFLLEECRRLLGREDL